MERQIPSVVICRLQDSIVKVLRGICGKFISFAGPGPTIDRAAMAEIRVVPGMFRTPDTHNEE